MNNGPQFSEEEAEQILRLAARQSGAGVSQDRLLEMARELGISPDAVLSAAGQVREQTLEKQEQEAFVRERRAKFRQHLISYVTTNVGMMAIDLATTHHLSWSLIVMACWAIGVFTDAVSTFLPNSEGYQKEFVRWQRKRRAKLGRTDSEALAYENAEARSDLESMLLRERLSHKRDAVERLEKEFNYDTATARQAVEAYDRANPGAFR